MRRPPCHEPQPDRGQLVVEAPGVMLAFAAGLASFLSPCCLPLVPGYLAAIFGHDASNTTAAARRRVLGRSAAFVATFSVLFIAFGLTATVLGRVLFDNQPLLNKIGGATMITMGALYAASPFTARLSRQWKVASLTTRASVSGSPVVGVALAGTRFASLSVCRRWRGSGGSVGRSGLRRMVAGAGGAGRLVVVRW